MPYKALFVALMLLYRTSFAADACAADDAVCITRKALEYKYKADALQKENDLLRTELEEERARSESAPKIFIVAMFVGAAFFGGFYTASKAFR